MSNFDSTKTRLEELPKDVVAGKIQLPDFQRGWVWDDEHIRSPLTSIARAFPIGAVMLLENGDETRFKVRPVQGVDQAAASPDKVEKLILDGQQRLTSLTQVLMFNKPVETQDQKKRLIKRHYYIDIEKALEGPEFYEEAILGVDEYRTVRDNFGRDIRLDLSNPQMEYQNFCFPCDQILKREIETAFGEAVVWLEADTLRQRYIRSSSNLGGIEDEDNWPRLQADLVDCMVRFDYIASL